MMMAGPAAHQDWMPIFDNMKVVRLTPLLGVVAPALALPALSKSTRGLTLPAGRPGLALGALLVVASAIVGYMLVGPVGPIGPALSVWLLGTAGAVMVYAAPSPTAFVKPICTSCRLLPVIKEHEAIHLSGTASEKDVWESMRTRHTVGSLSLEGDPSICHFCPIPKRLAER